jgi:allantoin racemase
MKIGLLVPWGPGELTIEEHDTLFREVVRHPEVEILRVNKGKAAEGKAEVAFSMPDILKLIQQAERDGFDAVVVVCSAEPGVEEARYLVSIPVFGPTSIALHTGLTIGHRVGVITSSQVTKSENLYTSRACGLESFVSIESIDMTMTDIKAQRQEFKSGGKHVEVIDKMMAAGIKLIEEENVSVLTLGCNALTWFVDKVTEELKKKGYDIPFVNPLPLAVRVAKNLAELGLTHSRIMYPKVGNR